MNRLPLCCLCLTVAFATGAPLSAAEAPAFDAQNFRHKIQPLLKQHCYDCHGEDEQEGKLRLDTLNPDLVAGPHAETWHDVLQHLNLDKMPPEDVDQPSIADRVLMTEWLSSEFKRLDRTRRSTGGHVVLRRLTRYEYNNTMRDLLGMDLDFAKDLPPEPTSHDGFKNNGAVLGISPLQIEYYLKAARSAVGKAIVTSERPEVYTRQATTSDKGGKKAGKASDRLVTNEEFFVRLDDYPREGRFRIRVHVRAETPEGAGMPRMQVSIGLRSDTISPEETVAEVDVTASKDKAEAYDFVGRIEEYPLPGHNPKFPGLLLHVRNVYAGQAIKKSKPKKNDPQPETPTLPAIIVDSLEFEGPLIDSWPPESHTRILFEKDPADSETQYVRKVLSRFMERAYRRSVDQTDVELIVRFFEKVRPSAASFEEAIQETLARVLISPNFLYLIEPAGERDEPTPLSDFELATRLSYFLWSTMPDEELFDLARAGTLRNPKELQQQVRRMLADKRSWNFVENYTDQWLGLSGLERIAVNPEYYPDFDNRLKNDMRGETQHFFAEVLYNDLSFMTLIDSNFTMLNRRLAKHYGMPKLQGNDFQRVELNGEYRRGGLLAHGSMLLTNSTGEHSHPIKRGVWIMDRLLDAPPAPPPPDVPGLDKTTGNLASLSIRKRLEIHRTKPACNRCHAGLDPWGIPLENYDAVGLWRDEVKGPVRKKIKTPLLVEAESVLPNGHEIKGLDGLKAYLLEKEEGRLARACVKKMMSYSLGRNIDFSDRQAVDALTKKFAEKDYRLSELIVEIVKSESFRTK